jgi:hypothetical protein
MDFLGQSPVITYLCVCLTFLIGWGNGLPVDISQAATIVLPSVDIRSISGDCPKLQHLSWSKGGGHNLESAFDNRNQTVKKIILKLLHTKVSVACLIII